MTKLRRFKIEAGPDGKARLARADDGAWVPYEDVAALIAEAREIAALSLKTWGMLVGDCADPVQVAEEEEWQARLEAFLAKTQTA